MGQMPPNMPPYSGGTNQPPPHMPHLPPPGYSRPPGGFNLPPPNYMSQFGPPPGNYYLFHDA